MWKKVVLVVLVAGGAAAALVANRVKHAPPPKVERGTFVAAPQAAIIAEVARLQNWVAWSSQGKNDPNIRRTYGGPLTGAGASYYWSSGDRSVEGRLTVISVASDKVELEFEQVAPTEKLTDYTINVTPEGSGSRIVWSATRDGEDGLFAKAVGETEKRDQRMASEVEIGLGKLKSVLEAQSNMQAYRVERSTTIAAPDVFVLAEIMDFREWSKWIPQETFDPKLKRVFSGSDGQPGSTYFWSGTDMVGSGRVSMISSSADKVELEVEVERPADSLSDIVFTLAAEGANTRVVWTVTGEKNAAGKAIALLGSSPASIGDEMEVALARLKDLAEAAVPMTPGKRSKPSEPTAAKKKPMLEILADAIVLRPAT